jgi:hypothetical protein
VALPSCRKAAQDAAIKEHGERLEGLSQMAGQLASRQEAVLREQLLAVRRRHVQLCNQLLRVLRHVSSACLWLALHQLMHAGLAGVPAW